jgi:hypothetical protein
MMAQLHREHRSIIRGLLGVIAVVVLGGLSESLRAQTSETPARVQGVVFDSIGNHPLGGAMVQLIELPPGHGARTVVTDSLGRFQMDSVTAGNYMAGFLHPLLDSIGIEAANYSVMVRDGAQTHIALAVPSAQHIARAICDDGRAAGKAVHTSASDSVGMIVGHVRDANTGAPLPGTAVTLTWQMLVLGAGTAHTESRSLRATAIAEGWFAMCGLAPDDYQLRAEHGREQTGLLDVSIHPREIVRLSLLLASDTESISPDSASMGHAALSGIVMTHDKHPLEGAQVAVDGSTANAVTDAQGAFRLSGLPEGTRMAEARTLGYAPVRVRVELSRSEATTVSIVMSKQVATLDAVTVYGTKGRRMRDLTGFLDRRSHGFGHFMTQQEIDQANASNTCELLRRVPGVNVRDVGGTGCTANIRGSSSGALGQGVHLCEPKVYQDNLPYGGTLSEFSQSMSPHDIMGVEVYSTAAQPPQFPGSCGVIVIWTRSGS